MQLLHLEQQFSGPGPVVRGIEDEQWFILVELHYVGLHVMDYHYCFVTFCVIVFTHLVLGGVSLTTSSFSFFSDFRCCFPRGAVDSCAVV